MESPGTGAEWGKGERETRRGRKRKEKGERKKGERRKRERKKRERRKEKERKEEGKREENLITEVNLPTLIVKNNRFICSGTYLPGQLFFCRLPWRVLPKRRRWLHRLQRIHSRQTLAAVASGSPLPEIQPLP